jgi:S-adenosylmethionine/arginine decarboxylase-like enzyme
MTRFWGYHLIVNAGNCAHATIRSKPYIAEFSADLVRRIDMVPYGKPSIIMFGTGNKKGYTLVQLIETSNICAHFVEETNDMYLDVFSCKPFEQSTVVKIVDEYFKPECIDEHFLQRQACHIKNGTLPNIPQLK